MDVQIDVSGVEGSWGTFSGHQYEITIGGLGITMTPEQFMQLCDNLRPWVVEAPEGTTP